MLRERIGDESAGTWLGPTQIEPRMIAIDETANYVIDVKDQPHIKRIEGVYLYDAGVRTHLCSFAASYWLVHMWDRVTLTPRAERTLTADEIDRLYQKYEYLGGEDAYFDCSTIDALHKKWAPRKRAFRAIALPPEPIEDDVPYNEALDAVRQRYQENQPL